MPERRAPADAATRVIHAIAGRVVESEMARRLGNGRPAEVALPAGAPPVTLLAHRAFPRWSLERRLRFLRAMGWYPEAPPRVVIGVKPALPPDCWAVDWVAAVYGALSVEPALPAVAALLESLRSPAGSEAAEAALDAYFDQVADGVQPGWRQRHQVTPVPPAWSRLESVSTAADRWFGRGRSAILWPALAAALGRLGEEKRRRWR